MCSAAEMVNACFPLLKVFGTWICPHDFYVSDAKDLADRRAKNVCDPDTCGMIVQEF